MNREELAWAAGFFDGEGWVGISGYGKQLSLRIVQVDRRVLDRFAAAVELGRVTGPRPRRSPKWRPCHVYQLGGFQVCQAVIAKLWAWLGPVKREQFVRASATVRPRLARWVAHATTCKRGHPFSGENLIRTPNGRGKTRRNCRICLRASQARYVLRQTPEQKERQRQQILASARRFRATEAGREYHRVKARERYWRLKTAHALLIAI